MKLTVHTFTTIDGVMQSPATPDEDTSGGFDRGGWLSPHVDDVMGEIVEGWFGRAEAVLLGRHTSQDMHDYWSRVEDPGTHTWRVLNTGPKYVVSTTLTDAAADWTDTTVLRGDPVEAVRALKARDGGELQVHGSWRLVQTLHEAGLVDEYRLLVFPTSVGGNAKRLFPDGSVPVGFAVSDVRVTGTGAVAMTLVPGDFRQAGVDVVDGADTVVDLQPA